MLPNDEVFLLSRLLNLKAELLIGCVKDRERPVTDHVGLIQKVGS
jgi:hypothetical protein